MDPKCVYRVVFVGNLVKGVREDELLLRVRCLYILFGAGMVLQFQWGSYLLACHCENAHLQLKPAELGSGSAGFYVFQQLSESMGPCGHAGLLTHLYIKSNCGAMVQILTHRLYSVCSCCLVK